MITKNDIYGSGGELGAAKTATDFRMAAGIESNRVAMASDVNAYHNMSDKDLWVVCQELVNLLKAYNVNPNNSYNTGQQSQLADLFSNKLSQGYSLTGIDTPSWSGSAPTQNGNQITFPKFDVVFNTGVLYGNTQAQKQRTTVSATTLSANSSWQDGVHYIYAQTTAGSNVATIQHRQTAINVAEGATLCMLGSVFVINGAFQSGSWKFQPWLQITSAEHREMPTAMTKGGFITRAAQTVSMGPLQIMDEGINWDDNRNNPDIMSVTPATPTSFKYVYPGYNASTAANVTIDTTKICNIETGALETITNADTGTGLFIVIVPCVTPTGQTLLVPAMGRKTGNNFSQVFNTQQDAVNAVYGLEYNVLNSAGHSVVERAIFLGYSIVVKVGATDFTDPEQFTTIGTIPQALAGFTNAGGQSGGGSGAYVPMRVVTFTATNLSPTMVNNAINVVEGSTTNVTSISLPTTNAAIVNQMEIHYEHTAAKKGLDWPVGLKWWGTEPIWTDGQTYNIIVEYVNGAWRAGFLQMAS